ncbi:glycosyltransferase [candidate division KSB1 bacterium]|nr:glycosyltransferase [candidate division KSB1 bacterium]
METNRIKSILAISWSMPPFLSARSIQVSRTLRALARLGWDITLLTVEPIQGMEFSNENKLNALAKQPFRQIQIAIPERFFLYRSMHYLLPKAIWLPDHTRGWIRRAVAAGIKAFTNKPFDAIVSFAQPMSDHVVGRDIHRITGVPWIAHFSDPWVDSPFYRSANRWHDKKMREYERDFITEASTIIFTSDQTMDRVMLKYPPKLREKAFVIPHGFVTDEPIPTLENSGNNRMQIVHTGRFYNFKRTPEPILLALSFLKRHKQLPSSLEIHLIGAMPRRFQRMIDDCYLSNTVFYHGQLDYFQTKAFVHNADVLLLVDAPSKEPSLFLPSKLIDYLPAEKPILGITPQQGASADLLRRLDCPIIPPDDHFAIAATLLDMHSHWMLGTLNLSPQFRDVAREYHIDNTTQKFAELLESYTPQYQEEFEYIHH